MNVLIVITSEICYLVHIISATACRHCFSSCFKFLYCAFFLRDTLRASFSRGFLILSSKMSGIENSQGSQHCYFNSLLQCLSINQTLFEELERHNINHITHEGIVPFSKKYSRKEFDTVLGKNFQHESSNREFILRIHMEQTLHIIIKLSYH